MALMTSIGPERELMTGLVKCIKKRNRPAIKAIPADSPSILSNRLKAFVMPTIQIMERKRLIVLEKVQLSLKPKMIRIDVITICAANLCCGAMLNMSSARPRRNIPEAQMIRGR
jgi:hypothetical protein